MSRQTHSAEEMLRQEYEMFAMILDETRQVVDHIDAQTTDSLMNLLDTRQRWIEELKRLEIRRRQMAVSVVEMTEFQRRMTNVAKSLVAIDAVLFDYVKVRKQEIAKEISKIADNSIRGSKRFLTDEKKAKVIDIRQE